MPRALLLIAAPLLLALLAFAACGGDDDGEPTAVPTGQATETAGTAAASPTPAATDTAPPATNEATGTAAASPSSGTPAPGLDRIRQGSGGEPDVGGSGAEYVLLLEEVPFGGFQNYAPTTRQVTNEDFVGASRDQEQAQRFIEEYGRLVGYQAEHVTPTEASVLSGPVNIISSVSLYSSPEGAARAFELVAQIYSVVQEFEVVELGPVGNEYMVHRQVQKQDFRGNEIDIVRYIVEFRRGNVLATLTLQGALLVVNPEDAVALARIMDEKILGQRPAPTPTPSTGGGTSTPETPDTTS